MDMTMQGKAARRLLMAAGLAGAMVIAGCSGPGYPDSESNVNTALTQNNLGAIHVSQDRDKGVITLTGTVPTEAQKEQAASVAKESASAYTIADQIAVVPPENAGATKAANSDIDSAIEDRFKAELKRHSYFKGDDISVKSTNGSVTLSGTAQTEFDKKQAEKLAKAIPNVQQVVNEIEVKK